MTTFVRSSSACHLSQNLCKQLLPRAGNDRSLVQNFRNVCNDDDHGSKQTMIPVQTILAVSQ